MKYILLATTLMFALLLTSCTDGERSKIAGYNSEHLVELLDCSGNTVKQWTSTGKVHSESNSDGYYFRDKDSGRLIETTGTLIITRL